MKIVLSLFLQKVSRVGPDRTQPVVRTGDSTSSVSGTLFEGLRILGS